MQLPFTSRAQALDQERQGQRSALRILIAKHEALYDQSKCALFPIAQEVSLWEELVRSERDLRGRILLPLPPALPGRVQQVKQQDQFLLFLFEGALKQSPFESISPERVLIDLKMILDSLREIETKLSRPFSTYSRLTGRAVKDLELARAKATAYDDSYQSLESDVRTRILSVHARSEAFKRLADAAILRAHFFPYSSSPIQYVRPVFEAEA